MKYFLWNNFYSYARKLHQFLHSCKQERFEHYTESCACLLCTILAITFEFKVIKCLVLVKTNDFKYQVLPKVLFQIQFWKKYFYLLYSKEIYRIEAFQWSTDVPLKLHIAFLQAFFVSLCVCVAINLFSSWVKRSEGL